MTPIEEIRQADALEAAASRDLYAAAPTALGVAVDTVAGATVLRAPKVPASYFNRVIGLGLNAPAREADLDAIGAAYRDAGVKSWWVHLAPGAQPPALADWLAARGYAPPKRRSWAKFLRDTHPAPRVETALAIRRAVATDAAAVGALVCSAYGMPESLAGWFGSICARTGWQVFVATAGARIVGTGSLFIAGDGAWLGVAGTLAEFRKRGAQGALLAARIAAAAAAGCAVLTTDTGEPMADEPNPSFHNIQRAGFRFVASRLNYEAPAG